MIRIYNRKPIIAARKLNRIAKVVWRLNLALALALVAYVAFKYGYAIQNDIGIFIPNVGGYNITLGGF